MCPFRKVIEPQFSCGVKTHRLGFGNLRRPVAFGFDIRDKALRSLDHGTALQTTSFHKEVALDSTEEVF